MRTRCVGTAEVLGVLDQRLEVFEFMDQTHQLGPLDGRIGLGCRRNAEGGGHSESGDCSRSQD
jgi:hypothetical protein